MNGVCDVCCEQEIHEREGLDGFCCIELAVRGKVTERKRRWKKQEGEEGG